MKRIVGLIEPLLMEQESSHIRNGVRLGLDGAIADALHRAVFVGNDEAEAPPRFAAKRIGM